MTREEIEGVLFFGIIFVVLLVFFLKWCEIRNERLIRTAMDKYFETSNFRSQYIEGCFEPSHYLGDSFELYAEWGTGRR